MGKDALIPLGKIVGTHGIKGYLKVFSYADSVDVLVPGKELIFYREDEYCGIFRIVSARPHKRVALLALDGITSIEAAELWVGCRVFVYEGDLPTLEEGTYYWYQIIGLEAFTVDKRCLGRVEAIWRTASNDVYVVRDGKKEVLIPAVDSVVVDIDLKGKCLRIDLPEGLEG